MSMTRTQAPPPSPRRIRPAAFALKGIAKVAPGIQPRVQKVMIRAGYQYLSRRNGLMHGYAFMNYGYAPLSGSGASDGEGEDLSAALYARVAGAVDLSGKDVLEVGCGRGGGADLVARTLGPRSVTGIDFAEGAIREARSRFSSPNLRFAIGDAENLPSDPNSFDAVLNVESSHCYPDVGRFAREVARVLRPQGVFLFADILPDEADARLRGHFAAAGFAVVEHERITPNVLRALELDAERRRAVIERSVPRVLRRAALEFVGADGSEVVQALRSGVLQYRRFVLQRT
ncbi:MAG TPA: class I SAM-dependent methyltransferase [Solirubrobacteraceae bacterium]|nr:class I SAM-dependent methyltransferase [Solirubrobacteraceae bacterium]